MLYAIPAIILSLALVYYDVPIRTLTEANLFLTIATFAFVIFAGFFIQRQGRRYSALRDTEAEFDGLMTSIFRSFGAFGPRVQRQAARIIARHYGAIRRTQRWSLYVTRKMTTLTDLHALVDRVARRRRLASLRHISVQRITDALIRLQLARKRMVALRLEHIPSSQWALILFLGAIVVVALSTIPSYADGLAAFLKASFATSILFIVLLLHRFDSLTFYEHRIGRGSNRDVLDIIAGRK